MNSYKTPPEEPILISAGGMQIFIPERTAKLLYISTGKPLDVSHKVGVSFGFNFETGVATVSSYIAQGEPSQIFTQMPVVKPSNPATVPHPHYCPTYYGLSPEQKWIYLNWLQDVSNTIDIGYVFIYYYGLERQLCMGDFDLTLHELVHLRKFYDNPSFISYSNQAVLYSSKHRQREERLKHFYTSTNANKGYLDKVELNILFQLGFDLGVQHIIDASRYIYGIDRKHKKYIKSDYGTFVVALQACLKARYGKEYLPFASAYKSRDLPGKGTNAYANWSIPPEISEQRSYDFLNYAPFQHEIMSLFAEAYERMVSFKAKRK